VWAMADRLCPDRRRAGIALVTAAAVLLAPGHWMRMAILALAGLAGLLLLPKAMAAGGAGEVPRIPSRRLTGVCWALVVAGLTIPQLLLLLMPALPVQVFSAFFRVGSLVFGGGHVVLPLLRGEVVDAGWLGGDRFLAGYGLAQMVPGPLFSFAAFLGAALPAQSPAAAVGAGALALVAIFLPGLLIALGSLRYFHALRTDSRAQRLVAGLNAGVVGLMIAVGYDPVSTGAIRQPSDAAFALLAFAALAVARWSGAVVVAGCALLVYLWSLTP